MRAAALCFALACLIAGSALAASKPVPAKGEPAPGSSVEMPVVIAPMNDADGRLVAYAYISSRVIATSPDTAVGVRDKTPFIQDGFIRDVNGRGIALAGQPMAVDRPALIARMLADARKVVGGKAVALSITEIQVVPLRPVSQS